MNGMKLNNFVPSRKRFRPNNTRRSRTVGFLNNPVVSIKEYEANNTRRAPIPPGHRTRTRRVVGSMNNRNSLQTSMKKLHQAIAELLATVHERNETPKDMIEDIYLMPTDQMLRDYLIQKFLKKYEYTEQNFMNFTNRDNMSNNL